MRETVSSRHVRCQGIIVEDKRGGVRGVVSLVRATYTVLVCSSAIGVQVKLVPR